jgi:hypothetical protein
LVSLSFFSSLVPSTPVVAWAASRDFFGSREADVSFLELAAVVTAVVPAANAAGLASSALADVNGI